MAEDEKTLDELAEEVEPTTQERRGFRSGWPVWVQQLPSLSFQKKPRDRYQLINGKALNEVMKEVDTEILNNIKRDRKFLDHELMRLFRERDFEASRQQNRYRKHQLFFMLLAALATLIGSLQALALTGNPGIVPLFALIETIIALMTTYLATVSGREPAMPLWLQNRRRAEYMRREYFRYLMNLPPYDEVVGFERQLMLSARAADINRGVYPDQEAAKADLISNSGGSPS